MPGQEHLKTYRTRQEAEAAARILREGGIDATVIDQQEVERQELDLDRGFHLMVDDVRWNQAQNLLAKAVPGDGPKKRRRRRPWVLVVGSLVLLALSTYLIATQGLLGGIGSLVMMVLWIAPDLLFWTACDSGQSWWGWNRKKPGHTEADDEPV
ncbi:MAG: hypothetical protein RL885_28475 [Planctomycetota bacterium]